MEKNFSPIVQFVYNRPEHTKRTIEGLLNNKETKDSVLYIFADGPKPSATEEDREKIRQVREFIHSITGFKEVIIEESETNKGLAPSTIYACTKIFEKYSKIIVMEDDDVPNQYFLSYVNRCLDMFENDPKIWCVSGYTDTSLLPPRGDDDLFLVNRPSSWGFGTWKRCWDKVIWDLGMLESLFAHKTICKAFDKWEGVDSSNMMKGLFAGRNSSWAIRFNFAAFLNKSLTILPTMSLIKNIGCDGSGTHSGTCEFHLQMMDHEVIIPEEIKFDPIRNKQLHDSFVPRTLKGKVRYWVISNFPNIYYRYISPNKK